MAQKTYSEKDAFLGAFEREAATTLKVLQAYPPAQSEFRPHERSKTARELAWMFVMELQGLAKGALDGKIEMTKIPDPPADFAQIVDTFERTSRQTATRLREMSEDDMNGSMSFMTGPKQTGDVRRFDVLWISLMDSIHHRGQFSVYLRMAGGKVPTIYGPSADEPWN